MTAPTRSLCSEPGPRPAGPMITVEGMPGAGKSTALSRLGARGSVLGEYISPDGVPLSWDSHPHRDQDDSHQNNWLRKTAQARSHLDAGAPVVVSDRDWLSSLSYAHSTGDPDLLNARCAWAVDHLERGRLQVAHLYLVVHVSPQMSLERRRHRLQPGHPWSTAEGVERLAAFYADPVTALVEHHARLAQALGDARWVHLDGDRPTSEVVAAITEQLNEAR